MLRNLRSRRRPRYGVLVCVVVWVVLVLLCVSVSVLHGGDGGGIVHSSQQVNYDSLLSDSGNDDEIAEEDTIDALDVIDDEPMDADADDEDGILDQNASAGYFFHHADGVIRRAFTKTSFMDGDDQPFLRSYPALDPAKTAFGSDDAAVEEQLRTKSIQVKGVEDALLLRVSPLREGWGDWFDKKGDFLRKDRMLRSNLDALNPLHNPLLQDPDAVALTGITKPDKIIRNYILHHLNTLAFPSTSRKITQHHNF